MSPTWTSAHLLWLNGCFGAESFFNFGLSSCERAQEDWIAHKQQDNPRKPWYEWKMITTFCVGQKVFTLERQKTTRHDDKSRRCLLIQGKCRPEMVSSLAHLIRNINWAPKILPSEDSPTFCHTVHRFMWPTSGNFIQFWTCKGTKNSCVYQMTA